MPTRAAAPVSLENIMLGEISPSQKDKHCLSPHMYLKSFDSWRQSRIVVARSWGKEGIGRCFVGTEIQFCKMK